VSEAIDLLLERDVARLLAEGDLDGATRRLRESPGSPLFTELVELDIRSRLVQAELPELLHLRERLERDAPANARYGLWLGAIVAECMIVRGDAASVMWAMAMLQDVTDEPYPAFPVLYARGRLRRIAAVMHLLDHSPAGRAAFNLDRDEAIADFVRCGFHAEALVTKAIAAGFVYITTSDEPWSSYDRLNEASAAINAVGPSAWGLALDALRGYVAFLVGDMAGAHAAWDDADANPLSHPLADAHRTVGRAVARLIGERAAPPALEGIDRAFDAVRLSTPLYLPGFHYQVAHVLADLGRPEATRYVRPSEGGAATVQEDRLLSLRARLVTGEVPSAADVKTHLAELAAAHRRRVAGFLAVRIARDYERLGQHGDAEALRQWGLDQLPAPPEQTLWELALSQPARRVPPVGGVITSRSGSAAGAGGVEIRVLEPQLTVQGDGDAVRLRDSTAKLLLALVVAHPQPLNIERAADVLWPDVDLRTARSRLNTLVHRLRSADPALARAIAREGNMLSLDEATCAVDLLAFRRRLAGSAADQRQALRSVRGNLCEVQFPYDEMFIDERRALASAWTRAARELLAAGTVRPAELAEGALVLGVDLDDLVVEAAAGG
jgi:hypothetical protein